MILSSESDQGHLPAGKDPADDRMKTLLNETRTLLHLHHFSFAEHLLKCNCHEIKTNPLNVSNTMFLVYL